MSQDLSGTGENRRGLSKMRLYLNGLVAVLAIVFSVATLAVPFNLPMLLLYLVISVIMTLLMYKIKSLLMSRVREQNYSDEATESDLRAANWRQIMILSATIVLVLVMPLLLVFVLQPTFWFVNLTGIMTGMGLSEILLYSSLSKQKDCN